MQDQVSIFDPYVLKIDIQWIFLIHFVDMTFFESTVLQLAFHLSTGIIYFNEYSLSLLLKTIKSVTTRQKLQELMGQNDIMESCNKRNDFLWQFSSETSPLNIWKTFQSWWKVPLVEKSHVFPHSLHTFAQHYAFSSFSSVAREQRALFFKSFPETIMWCSAQQCASKRVRSHSRQSRPLYPASLLGNRQKWPPPPYPLPPDRSANTVHIATAKLACISDSVHDCYFLRR